MFNLNIFFFIFIILVPFSELHTQQIFVTPEEIVDEMKKRGLEEEEVRDELLRHGIDLQSLDPASMSYEQIQKIEQIILDLEEKKKSETESVSSEVEPETDKKDTTHIQEDIPDSEEIEEKPGATIFGQELFRHGSVNYYQESDAINAPGSYVLGAGDELIVSIWGRSQLDENFVIGKDGFIRIADGNQRIFLRGMSLDQARVKLQAVLSRIYSFGTGEFDLALRYSRSVRISIYGEVFENPGSYTIPAFNSAFNALSLVKGPGDIGSLRKIQLQKNSGKLLTMDLYALLGNPSQQYDYFLEDNDVILIPVSENIVSIEGAVKRPMKYELLKNEGLKSLIEYCGGFSELAYKKKIQLKRFVEDKQKIIDIDYNELIRSGQDFILQHGDRIVVPEIESEYRNYVEVTGEVTSEGEYERIPGMTLVDLVTKAGLKKSTSTDLVFITRTNENGLTEVIKVQLAAALSDPSSDQNIELRDRDVIELWSKKRFNDHLTIAVSGSVRLPGQFAYDNSKTVRVRDAIMRAGGMSRDASNIAVVHKNDPLNPRIKSYKTIDNLDEIFRDPQSINNYILDPFDSLVVESKNTFIEESFVRIEGAVNRPGEYQYGQDMTIRDLLALAGGFKLAASTNNIEISRVIIRNNQPTQTVVDKLEIDRSYNVKGFEDGYYLEPFDNIAVRFINEFELQQRVFLSGEIKYPGPYAISENNERISSVINRAGGLTQEAFPSGATLERSENDYGSIVIKLDEILGNPSSEFNFVVKNGDKITVPKTKEFVTIRGATKVKEVVGEAAINIGNEIHVPYHQGKDAMFYINEYAGGLNELADRQKIFVEHANGEIKKPKNGLFRKVYPKVLQGSTITVGYKAPEDPESKEQSDVDWTKVLGDSVAQAMSILTLILLIERLD